ncbi:hypothetical protein BKP56_10825 [Marinilactibacillus sp. 15R]|uniref:helix-turn-helix domain-containing protein n=1 Tax=Marinilactibacillus sp. 15R TaxID=1911586 RepID=UPI00090A488D|nr:AraC family transcriptional regulator [Marinilactibacillus sp. 15R]API89722.1 hypothetical protein BKP56_10825 [Marinilactibacillus sp. 15R]
MTHEFTFLFGGLNVRHPEGFEMIRPYGVPNYVFLSIKSPALFKLNGQESIVEPNSIVIIEPFTPYYYHNPGGHYIDDWFHFKCEDSLFFQKKKLSTNHFLPIAEQTNIHLLMQELVWESVYIADEVKDENLSLIIQVMLNNVAVCEKKTVLLQKYSPHNRKLRDLRLQVQSYPKEQYSVEKIAKEMNISVSYFQHLYKDLFGVSFQKDVIRIKIEYAKHLLSITDLPNFEIADLCGYTSEVHFYRQFKKVTGLTPSHYQSTNETI